MVFAKRLSDEARESWNSKHYFFAS